MINAVLAVFALAVSSPEDKIGVRTPGAIASGKEQIQVRLQKAAVTEQMLYFMPLVDDNYILLYDRDPKTQHLPLDPLTEKEITGLPRAKRLCEPFVIALNAGRDRFAALIGSDGGREEPFDRIWIDWNRDRIFEQSEMTSGRAINLRGWEDPDAAKYGCFGPIKVPQGQGRPESIYLLQVPPPLDLMKRAGALVVQSASILAGDIEVASIKHRIFLADADLDGRFELRDGGDDLMLQMKNEGKLVYGVLPAIWPEPGKPGSVYAQLPDSKLYQVGSAEDGTLLTFSRDPAAFGSLSGFAVGGEVRLAWRGYEGYMIATDGTVSFPPGEVSVSIVHVAKLDAQGRPYTYRVFVDPVWTVQVEKGKTAVFQPSLPLKMILECEVKEGRLEILVSMRDSSDRRVGEFQGPDGKDIGAATITIRDANGKVVFKKLDVPYENHWQPPKGGTGPFTVTATLDLGPLGQFKESKTLNFAKLSP